MKKVLAILLGLVMVTSFAGCSLFGGSSEAAITTGDIKITDSFTHTDPTDIEFESRYTLYSGDNQELIGWYKEDGYNFLREYFVLYGDKDDVPVLNYIYYVFETDEDANKYVEDSKQYYDNLDDFNLEVKENVVIMINDQDELNNIIDGCISMGVMDDTTASYYAKQNMVQFDELINYTGE